MKRIFLAHLYLVKKKKKEEKNIFFSFQITHLDSKIGINCFDRSSMYYSEVSWTKFERKWREFFLRISTKKKRKKRIFSSPFKSFDNKIVLIILIDPRCIIAKFREQNSKENEENFSCASPLKKKKEKERKKYFLLVSNHSPR